jgi:hypothetical protein
MFAPLFRFRHRQPDPRDLDQGFFHETRVDHPREPRSRRVERVLVIGWILVLAKCLFVAWAVKHHPVPFHAAWLIGPTLAFAALCTLVYWRRD